MTNQQPNDRQYYKVKAGRDAKIVGGDYTNSQTVNFWIPFLFLGVLGLGSLAWAVNSGLLKDSGNPQQVSTPAPSQTKGNTNP